jgi:cell division protein ZapE
MSTLNKIYHDRVRAGDIHADPAQEAVLPMLEDIRHHLETTRQKKRGILGGLFHKAEETPMGLYLWGGVGRGKSFLMDLFVDNIAIDGKRRVHFHAFMQEVHAGMHKAREQGVDDALAPVAAQIAKDVRLFAFDEMQITDITDAMIVGRLFEMLMEAGVVIVTTSNRIPDELYKDGLNRQLFLPFIALLKDRMVVHELISPTDYRQNRLEGEQVYFTPPNAEARAAVNAIWADLTGGQAKPHTITVKGRDVVLPAFHNGVARAGFHDLCGAMLGPGDYLAIAETVKVLILDNIPALSRSNFNEAKRFVTLIDALYEARVRLIATAAAQPEMLYIEGAGSFEFERTASRLREMQDKDWGQAPA